MRRLAPALLSLAACHGPAPVEANVEFQTERGVVRGVSTEAGILALVDVLPESGEISFRCRIGNSFFDDVADLVRRGDALALLSPRSSRPPLARFAAYPAALDDTLYVEVRTVSPIEDVPDLLRAHLLEEGRRGDLLVLDEALSVDIAHRYAGAGVFAFRDGSMELVGILNGVYLESPRALAFVGLDEMATLIPAESSYFERRPTVRRADFEYGVPRDFAGERSHASDEPRRGVER